MAAQKSQNNMGKGKQMAKKKKKKNGQQWKFHSKAKTVQEEILNLKC